jgi:rRNA maturation protein Rpf1
MGLGELASRILQAGARAAIVISMWRGNPGDLSFIDSGGSELALIRVESALLRRETLTSGKPKVTSLLSISVRTDSSDSVKSLASLLQSLLDLPVEYHSEPSTVGVAGQCQLWLESTPSGKIIWTHYHALDGTEIGPRIRIKEVRSPGL